MVVRIFFRQIKIFNLWTWLGVVWVCNLNRLQSIYDLKSKQSSTHTHTHDLDCWNHAIHNQTWTHVHHSYYILLLLLQTVEAGFMRKFWWMSQESVCNIVASKISISNVTKLAQGFQKLFGCCRTKTFYHAMQIRSEAKLMRKIESFPHFHHKTISGELWKVSWGGRPKKSIIGIFGKASNCVATIGCVNRR